VGTIRTIKNFGKRIKDMTAHTVRIQSKQQGFTLIELVIVIVLLGILAATALPKFADLTGQAQKAANRGSAGGLASAIMQAHAMWLVGGSPPTVTFEGGTVVHMNSGGWPDGIGTDAAATNDGCTAIWSNILQNPTKAVSGATGCGANTPCYNATYENSTCKYTLNGNTSYTIVYTQAGTTGAGGVVAAP
jgi:prepilin-type N-terminal cleavage/methylation domain-containing protein